MSTATISEIYAPKVAAGAEFLDSKKSGWHTQIDKTTLNFPSLTDCILGQLYGDYHRGLALVGKDDDWGLENGFSMHFYEIDWDALTDLWLAEIAKRETAEVTV